MEFNTKVLILASIFWFGGPYITEAQEWVDSTVLHYRPKVAFKFAPLAFLSTTSAIQIGGEIRTFTHQSFQVEYGYVNDFKLFDNDYDGFKLKTEYRFYNPFRLWQPRSRYKKRDPNFFLGVQYFRKEVEARGRATVSRSNNSYQEILPLSVHNKTDAFFLVFGKVIPLGPRFATESVIGIGGKNLEATVEGLPEDGELTGNITRGWFFDLRDGRGDVSGPDLFFSFKLIYAFL